MMHMKNIISDLIMVLKDRNIWIEKKGDIS